MDLRELKSIGKRGEGQYIEFKKNANHPDQIVDEIVGFANSTGGSLFIGIDDNGEPTGLKFPEDDMIFLTTHLQKTIAPHPVFTSEIINISKKRGVIHFQIKAGSEKPYAVISTHTDRKKVLYRLNDECLQASRELRSILKGSRYQRGQVIKYSELEADLLKFIERNPKIGKRDIIQGLSYTSRKISDCLVRLVLAGVLKIIPTPKEDLYEYNQQF